MITTIPIGCVRRNGKPFPLSVLKPSETFNNYNGEPQRLTGRFRDGATGPEVAAVLRLGGWDKGKTWYCYQPDNPICYADSALVARRWEARLKRARIRAIRATPTR